MSDTPPAAPTAEGLPQDQGPPNVRVLAQYVRDLSFENPQAPESLRGGPQPQIDLSVEMNARGRHDGLFEVDLKLGAKASRDATETEGAQIVFQVELVYGGLFEVTGVAEDQLEPLLLAECPRYLFPFARRVIADCTGDGGFTPFLLEPIDFAAVYAAQRAQREGAIAQPAAGTA